MITLLLLACTPGELKLGAPAGDDTGITDSGDTQDTQDTEPAWDPNGEYEGTFEFSLFWDAFDFGDDCEEDRFDFEVDDLEVDGHAACTFDWDGGYGFDMDLYVTGTIDEDDLSFEGEVLVQLNDGVREGESDTEGEFTSETVRIGGGGKMTAYDETMDYEWLMDLELK